MGFTPSESIVPQDVQRAWAKPGEMQKQFLQYLEKGGYDIDQSKTIAQVAYGCIQVAAGGETRLEFFNQRVNGFTKFQQNTPDERPQSEHAVIWAIQILSGDGWVQSGVNVGPDELQLLSLNINNVTVLDEVDISNLRNPSAIPGVTSSVLSENNGMIFLPEPIIWPGQTSALATLEFGTALGADNTYQIVLFGMGLV